MTHSAEENKKSDISVTEYIKRAGEENNTDDGMTSSSMLTKACSINKIVSSERAVSVVDIRKKTSEDHEKHSARCNWYSDSANNTRRYDTEDNMTRRIEGNHLLVLKKPPRGIDLGSNHPM